MPEQVRFFCEQCGREQAWQEVLARAQRVQGDRGFQQRAFRCRNCKEQYLYIAYEWSQVFEERDGKKESHFLFRKHGQWPTLEERVSPELEEALRGSEDLAFYKAALRLRNFGHGVGAMGYMRRVVENHMNEMLEILDEEARNNALGLSRNVEGIEKLRFADKLEQAASLFPKYLTPDNLPNPLAPLYVLTSDALHNLSEDEAVALFDQCRAVFEEVFSNLRPHLRRNKSFVNSLREIAEVAAKAKK